MVDKPGKLRAALMGGLLIGIISGVPGLSLLNCCCCAGILLGGAVAVYFYKQEFTEGMPPLESSDALIIGIVAGIAGALIAIAISSIVRLAFGPVESEFIRTLMNKFIDKLASRGAIPQSSIDEMQSQFDQAINEGLTFGSVLRSLVFALIIYPIFSMLGGLIGFGIFGKRKPAPPNPF